MRRLLATRGGFSLVIVLEVLLMSVVLPWEKLPEEISFIGFWTVATLFYFSNYRVWRWLQGRQDPVAERRPSA